MPQGPDNHKPEQSLGFLMNDVARLMRRNFNRRVQELELTQAQWQALAHIYRNPGLRQSQLADILEVQPISVARLIDRMECAGWVTRSPDPQDRRAVNLNLTDKAMPILHKMQDHAAIVRAQAFVDFTAAEQKAMIDYLTLMRRNLTDQTEEEENDRAK